MDVNDLFLSCRRGDLPRLQYLVEQKEIDLNVRDKWDSTPLYYACLCGHEDMVKYLLDHGGKCEANTFEGERCLYGALNNEIRNILRSYKTVTSVTIKRDHFTEVLRRGYEKGLYSDVTFEVHGHHIQAHRCILSARCPYFADMFQKKWQHRKIIHLTNKLVTVQAFRSFLQYLYTARLESHIDHLEDIFRLAKQCRLPLLMKELEAKMKKVESFESTKPGVNVTMIVIEPMMTSNKLQRDLGALADYALPNDFIGGCKIQSEMPFPLGDPLDIQLFPDLIIKVEGHKFYCHRVFLCERSDYFKALVEDHFGEGETENRLPVIRLTNMSINVFVQVLYYVYQDSCYELTMNNVYDVLCAGDLYLMPGLKRHCANVICRYLDLDNVIHILHTARLFDLPRLEDQCANFMASYIEKVAQMPEFAQLVLEDAGGVKNRQQTDSIPIIDDIRYHIQNFVQTFSDMDEADQRLMVIDQLLEDLELEG